MPAFLVPVKPGLCVIPLEKAVVLIGRQADCDVSLTQSRKVSRKHCCLAQVNDKIMVRDLGSTNGIYINGQRVKREGRVRLGDILTVGDLQFRMQTHPNPQYVDVPPLPRSVEPQPARSPAKAQAEVASTPSLEVPVVIPEVKRVSRDRLGAEGDSSIRNRRDNDSGPLIPLLDEQSDPEDDVIPLGSDSF
ncbi:MAG: FHA domain-containing protein [Planctomycetaceae bacterium]